MLRVLLVPRSVLGFGLRIGLLFVVLTGITRGLSIALTQVLETGYVLGLLFQIQGPVILSTIQTVLNAPTLGHA